MYLFSYIRLVSKVSSALNTIHLLYKLAFKICKPYEDILLVIEMSPSYTEAV